MRDPARIDVLLSTLRRTWEERPDLRLGQLIVIATRPKESCLEVFNIEDDALLEGLASYGRQPKGKS
jgi:hypothetical protein